MLYWIVNSVLSFLCSVLIAALIIPQILLIAFRRRLFDMPDDRKIHNFAVPRLGGFAFMPVICFVLVLLLGISTMTGHFEFLYQMRANIRHLAFAFCSCILLYMIGLADDLIGIRYRGKFIIQIFCGILMITGGIYINDLHGVLGIYAVPKWLGYPLTILLTVFIINSINLIDGIDGLASGLSSVACLFYGLIFFMLHDYIFALIAFATVGVLLSFFYYNVFGDPKRGRKIFMGDTGSLTVGMLLCFCCIRLTMCIPKDIAAMANPMVLAFTPLMVPCCDVVRVYFYRLRNKKNPFLPDKNHIHHKLLAIGMSQRWAMITIVAVSILFVALNVILSPFVDVNLIVLGDVLIWTLANVWLSKRIRKIHPIPATEQLNPNEI